MWCACMGGLFMMVGTICLQFGMALTSMAVCLPHQIAISLSVGAQACWPLTTHLPFAMPCLPRLVSHACCQW